MNMKKRTVSLILVVCMAISMMVTMTACGKKSLEDYMNSSAMQKMVETYTTQYESQGMGMKMYAEGDDLHMDVIMNDVVSPSSEELALYKETLEAAMEQESSTFVDMANQMKDACSNSTVNVVVTYLASDGATELGSMSFASTK